MTTVAIIPARGGSTRIPRKNVRELAGRPLIDWTIDAALESNVDRVVVSTDDSEIANHAESRRVAVCRRSPETSGDGPLEPVIAEAAKWSNAHTVVILQPTSPLRTGCDVSNALATFDGDHPVSSVHLDGGLHFSCSAAHADHFPIPAHHMVRIHDGRPNTQDAKWHRENGAVYVLSAKRLHSGLDRHSGHFVPYVMERARAVDIDTEEDWLLAEALLLRRKADRARDAIGTVTTLVCDVDGVLTDNVARVTADGTVVLSFDRSDGMGLVNMRKRGVRVLAVSGSDDAAAASRCRVLGVEYHGGVHDKVAKLEALRVDWKRTAYVGNDMNDQSAMMRSAWSAAPSDAHPSAIKVAQHVTNRPGGHGAVREVCDLLCGEVV